MIYCVDSNIIIWGIKKQSSKGQEEMIERAEIFFRKVDEYKDFIIIPSIVLAEILAPEPAAYRAKYLEIINNSFIIANFDTRAALKYAEIMNGRFEEVKQIASEADIPRQKMKADHMVISIAIVNGANCIYSTDNGLKTFAKGYIDVQELPHIKEIQETKTVVQRSIFEDEDSPF
jgi:predicted nucleic acid-binding protein